MAIETTDIQDLVFGDVGKGKLAHVLGAPEHCDVAVRAVGGGNAGHVICDDGKMIALHVLPAAGVYKDVRSLLGRGMVTHIPTIFSDAAAIEQSFGVDPLNKLTIAGENHMLFEGHKAIDRELEKRRGKNAIGTTFSGIGPAYADKAYRVGMRFEELAKSETALKDRYLGLLKHWKALFGPDFITPEQEATDIASLEKGKALLEGKVMMTVDFWTEMENSRAIVRALIEGAQGSELCIDSEGYPNVTASACTELGHFQGAGLARNTHKATIGAAKGYTTRVGGGPLNTEITGPLAERLQGKGVEKGSTSGRTRRVGWLDTWQLARRVKDESVTKLAILKSDVLDGLDEVKLATGRDANNNPTYETLPGWDRMNGAKHWDEIPKNAQAFLERIHQLVGNVQNPKAPLSFIGTGRDKKELIML